MRAGAPDSLSAGRLDSEEAAVEPRARIGPNAIIQVAAAAREVVGADETRRLFAAASLRSCLDSVPEAMVDEADVARLHRTVRQMFSRNAAEGLLLRAGDLTGEYVLAHRIPRPVRTLLPWLPDRAAANLLCAAIRRHAWTFAGSGRFEARAGSPVRLAIVDNPMCRELRSDTPACHYYAATFERLFRALVNERASVVEVACEASGARSCRFEVGWAKRACSQTHSGCDRSGSAIAKG